LIAKLSADLYRLVGAVTARAGTIAAALPWGLGQAGPTTSASESIRRHILAGSILVGVLALVPLRLADPRPLEGLRVRTFDFFQVLRPRPQEIRPVVIVDIDEASLKAIGQWP
jgi:CHASE2 domain-containing sensor protein